MIEHHEVVIDPDAETVNCKLGDFTLRTKMWSPNLTRRLAHLHAADPSASTEQLLEFVAGTDENGVAGEPRTGGFTPSSPPSATPVGPATADPSLVA